MQLVTTKYWPSIKNKLGKVNTYVSWVIILSFTFHAFGGVLSPKLQEIREVSFLEVFKIVEHGNTDNESAINHLVKNNYLERNKHINETFTYVSKIKKKPLKLYILHCQMLLNQQPCLMHRIS